MEKPNGKFKKFINIIKAFTPLGVLNFLGEIIDFFMRYEYIADTWDEHPFLSKIIGTTWNNFIMFLKPYIMILRNYVIEPTFWLQATAILAGVYYLFFYKVSFKKKIVAGVSGQDAIPPEKKRSKTKKPINVTAIPQELESKCQELSKLILEFVDQHSRLFHKSAYSAEIKSLFDRKFGVDLDAVYEELKDCKKNDFELNALYRSHDTLGEMEKLAKKLMSICGKRYEELINKVLHPENNKDNKIETEEQKIWFVNHGGPYRHSDGSVKAPGEIFEAYPSEISESLRIHIKPYRFVLEDSIQSSFSTLKPEKAVLKIEFEKDGYFRDIHHNERFYWCNIRNTSRVDIRDVRVDLIYDKIPNIPHRLSFLTNLSSGRSNIDIPPGGTERVDLIRHNKKPATQKIIQIINTNADIEIGEYDSGNIFTIKVVAKGQAPQYRKFSVVIYKNDRTNCEIKSVEDQFSG